MSRVFLVGVLLLALHGGHASAGENRLLGTLTSTGTSVNNATTAVPFVISPGSKVTVVCDGAARILTDSTATANTGATKGLPLELGVRWPTSVGSQNTLVVSGTTSGLIALISQSGTVNCDVWRRDGTE